VIGTVGNYAGPLWALAIYLILGAMLAVLGYAMHKTIKFEPTGLCVEIPELRLPSVKQTAIKTYLRIKEFLTIALPLLLIGSVFLEILLAAGWLQMIVDPAAPFMMAVLGLPALTAVALVFGVLRKEMSLQMLIVLFGTSNLALYLSPEQMFVFALVMSIFMPCLAALAVLVKEFGVRSTAAVIAASISLAFLAGAVAKIVLIGF
jgi:ferrous iron transport protein B